MSNNFSTYLGGLGMSDVNGLIGKTILGYDVIEFIGHGGFGKVYKAVKVTGNDNYYAAIKHIVLPNENNYNDILNSMGGNYDAADNYFESMLSDVIAEIKTLFSLSKSNNQNIVTYYDHDIVKHTNPLQYEIFIRMEYLTPLSTYIRENDITLHDVLKLGVDVSNALEYCHSQGVIHRDVKDDNIFINEEGNYKLGDFGISKVLMDTRQEFSIKGTPVYMAPEVILGKKYNKTVDIYSLGILLYKLLNHNRIPFLPIYPLPFTGRDAEIATEKRLSGEELEAPIHSSYGLGKVILKACGTEEKRYIDAKQMAGDLSEVLRSMPKEELTKILYKRIERNNDKNESVNINNNDDVGLTVGANVVNNCNINRNDENYKEIYLFETEKGNSYKGKSFEVNGQNQQIKHKKISNKFVFGVILGVIIILMLGIVFVKIVLDNKNTTTVNNSKTEVTAESSNNQKENKTQADSVNANIADNNINNPKSEQKKIIDVSKCSQTIFEGKTKVTITSVDLKGEEMTIKGEVDNQAKETVSGYVSEFYLKDKDNNVNKLDFYSNPAFHISAPSGGKTKFQMIYNNVDKNLDSVALCGEFFLGPYFGNDKKIQIDIPLK